MNWQEIKFDKDESQRYFEEYCVSKKVDFPEEYRALRNDVCQQFDETLALLGISPEMIAKKNFSYQVDYIFGLKLFHLLNEKYEMNMRAASSADVWRFLCVRVVPDVIEKRYSVEHPDRYWKKPNRLWLRTVWWYIYLSWQGNDEDTISAIKDNSTDEIAQLVDRCGRNGYRVELYREIIKQHGKLNPTERRKTEIFRKMMKLNTARVQVIEPGLVAGGETSYVNELKNYFMES